MVKRIPGYKCIPGVMCFENMTLFIILIVLLLFFYLWLRITDLGKKIDTIKPEVNMVMKPEVNMDTKVDQSRCGPGRGDPLTNPYVPPIRCDSEMSLPAQIPTQKYDIEYKQVGILSREDDTTQILPLFGRRLNSARQKWQYYTISGGGPGGNLQTKLPILVKGKNASGEYGVDEIYNRDEVYVEGFGKSFKVTIYENGMFSYLPY